MPFDELFSRTESYVPQDAEQVLDEENKQWDHGCFQYVS